MRTITLTELELAAIVSKAATHGASIGAVSDEEAASYASRVIDAQPAPERPLGGMPDELVRIIRAGSQAVLDGRTGQAESPTAENNASAFLALDAYLSAPSSTFPSAWSY